MVRLHYLRWYYQRLLFKKGKSLPSRARHGAFKLLFPLSSSPSNTASAIKCCELARAKGGYNCFILMNRDPPLALALVLRRFSFKLDEDDVGITR